MTGDSLMAELSKYIENIGIRQSIIRRLKAETGLDKTGGRTKDLCYFTGTVKLLRKLDDLDIGLLFSGKVSVEDLPRVKRISRTCSVPIPSFASDIPRYVAVLQEMRRANELCMEC